MSLNSHTRVGFTLIGGKKWTGGYNYLINLFTILSLEMPDSLFPFLFVGNDVSEADLLPFLRIPGCAVIRDPAFNSDRRSGVLLRSVFLGLDPVINRALQKAKIDVVFESGIFLGWRFKLPTIAWIPDLQHRFLPHLFGKISWVRRELGFRLQIWSDRIIMCSSQDTLENIERIYPSAKDRVSAVRFAIKSHKLVSKEIARAVADRHGFPVQYFFMPNQFWAHKNHRLVLDALKILSNRGISCVIVASGQQSDPRDEHYAPSLLADIQNAGLQKTFLTPGLLPYDDLPFLMQASDALINPSLFEGWSTTVEEAKAASIPMILSDIPVHREQAGKEAIYFNPNSPEALADALMNFSLLGKNKKMQRDISGGAAAKRSREFAYDFFNIVERAIRNNSKKSI